MRLRPPGLTSGRFPCLRNIAQRSIEHDRGDVSRAARDPGHRFSGSHCQERPFDSPLIGYRATQRVEMRERKAAPLGWSRSSFLLVRPLRGPQEEKSRPRVVDHEWMTMR